MSNEVLLETLRKGRERIARGRCKWRFAIDITEKSVDPDSERAVRWCARGAVGSDFIRRGLNTEAEAALVLALPAEWVAQAWRARTYKTPLDGSLVADYNNTHTQADVLALFDRAIASLTRRTDAELVAECVQRAEQAVEARVPEAVYA